jgi:hypothetical protein
MKKALIYKKIREASPVGIFTEPDWLEALEKTPLPELLQDLDDLYTSWGKITQLPSAYTEEEIRNVQEHESLFDFILHAIFSYGDPSVIPQLLKYVPSDDEYEDEDLVFLEDYSSEPLCNGITSLEYFGEKYVPILLEYIHVLIPRAMKTANWFLLNMIRHNWQDFLNTQPLMRYLNKTEINFLQLVNYSVDNVKNEIEQEKEVKWIKKLQMVLDQIYYVRQQFLKLHASD